MLLTDYTTYDEVRAALGVNVDEVDDATLALPLYENILQVELEDIDMDIPTLYESVSALPTPTDDQLRFMQAAHLFATYAVAKQLTTSLPLFSPEQITDGKAMIRRNQDTPYKAVIEAVAREYTRFKSRLEKMFAVVNSTSAAGAVAKTYFSVASPTSDPITGA